MPRAVFGVFAIFYVLFILGMVAAWIVVVVAIWRGMKAHESLAASMRVVAHRMHTGTQGQTTFPSTPGQIQP